MKTLIFYSLLILCPILLLADAEVPDSPGNGSVLSSTGNKMKAVGSTGEMVGKVEQNWQNKKDDLVDQYREKIQDRWQKKCDGLTKRITERLSKFETNKDRHIAQYNHLRDKVAAMVAAMDEKGYDVEDLSAHLVTLDEMIVEYATEYAAFIELLEATEDYVCGESEGSFAEAVKAARDQLRVVHQKRLEIRAYYKDVIREDIKELRSQLPDLSAVDDSASEVVTEEEN